jgi:general secretion pathway protein I
LSRSTCHSRVAGFTLIEVLVALAVVATSLAAIGAVVAVSVKGTRSLEERLAFTETMRAILTSLPDRRDLNIGTASGDTAGYLWRIDVTPFIASFVDPRSPTPWQPQAVVIRVQSPTGRVLQVNTIRLRRRAG